MAPNLGRPLKVAQFYRRNESTLALALAGSVLALAALLPLANLVTELIGTAGTALGVWSQPRSWELFASSILLAFLVTLLALAIGVPVGVLLGRTDVHGRRVAWLLHAFPMFLPPFIQALGWSHLLGGGVLFNAPALICVLGLTFAPIASALVALGVMSVDPSLEEVARTCARSYRVATRILLPSATHALGLAAITIFALAYSEVGVPMFLRVDTFSSAVFARLGGVAYAPGEAFALTLPVLVLALALLALERRWIARRSYAVLGLRSRFQAPLALGAWRWPLTMACWAAALISLAPLAALAAHASGDDGFGAVSTWAGRAPWNGLVAGSFAATLIVGAGVVVGHAAARNVRLAGWLDALAMLAFLTPGAVMGVGLIAAWNRPATQFVYATLAIVVLGFVARYAILGVRVVASVVAQMPAELEDAAAVGGAGYTRRLAQIVLPLGARGIVGAWFIALVFSLRDLDSVVLFYPPGYEPLSVRIFTLEANGPAGVVAALAALQAAITAAVLALGLAFSRRRSA